MNKVTLSSTPIQKMTMHIQAAGKQKPYKQYTDSEYLFDEHPGIPV